MNIYLAIPYSGIEEESFKIANYVAHKLMEEGHIVYSPITHNHPIAKAHGLPTGWDFWEKFDTEFIKWCDEVYVVVIRDELGVSGEGLIENSKGVNAEIKIAKSLGRGVSYIHYFSEHIPLVVNEYI